MGALEPGGRLVLGGPLAGEAHVIGTLDDVRLYRRGRATQQRFPRLSVIVGARVKR